MESLAGRTLLRLTPCKGHSGDTIRQEHRDSARQVRPVSEVVAGPHCAEALRAGKKGTSEYEGTLWDLLALNQSLSCKILLQSTASERSHTGRFGDLT